MKREEGAKYTADTTKRYEISIERLKKFLLEEYNTKDIKLSRLNYRFIAEYEIFLPTEYKIKHNTVMKYLKHLKKVVHFAMKREYIDRDPFSTYQTAYNESHREFLTQEELERIESHKFRIPRLDLVKDIFLFVCYTGISYKDLKLFQRDKLSIGIDGKNWLRFGRNKTDVLSRVPLLQAAQAILDKYKDHTECAAENRLLPMKSNNKLNTYLTEIAELCEINKNITMHVGRHTFATLALTNGVPIETVSKMLGHKSIKTTQIYSQVIDTKISNDMDQLEKALNKKADTKQEPEIQPKKEIV